MSVTDVILFCSTTSRASVPCLQIIQQNNMPIRVVRLDTIEMRERVAQGKYFQIRNVPTLVVVYEGNNLQQFVGQPKIMAWLQGMLKQHSRAPRNDPHEEPEIIPEEIESEVVSLRPKPVRKHRHRRHKSRRSSRSHRRTKPRRPPMEPEFSSGEEPDFLEVQSGQGLYDGKSKARKSSKKHHRRKEKEPITFIPEGSEGEEIDIQDVDPRQRGRPPPPPTQGLLVGPHSQGGKSRMVAVFDVAKQMAQQRKQSLGYEEKDLPVTSF